MKKEQLALSRLGDEVIIVITCTDDYKAMETFDRLALSVRDGFIGLELDFGAGAQLVNAKRRDE